MNFHRRSCLAVLLMLAACQNQKVSNDSRTVVDSSGAYPVITAPRQVAEWRAEPIVVVATAGGESGEFGSIRSILLASDGTLYVVDPSKPALSIFDSSGRFVRQLGREGSGPGEYREPYSIAWIGKSLALLDPRNGRLGLFDSTGQWLTSWRVPLHVRRTVHSPLPNGADRLVVRCKTDVSRWRVHSLRGVGPARHHPSPSSSGAFKRRPKVYASRPRH